MVLYIDGICESIFDKNNIEFKDEKSNYLVLRTKKGELFKFAFNFYIMFDYLFGLAK